MLDKDREERENLKDRNLEMLMCLMENYKEGKSSFLYRHAGTWPTAAEMNFIGLAGLMLRESIARCPKSSGPLFSYFASHAKIGFCNVKRKCSKVMSAF